VGIRSVKERGKTTPGRDRGAAVELGYAAAAPAPQGGRSGILSERWMAMTPNGGRQLPLAGNLPLSLLRSCTPKKSGAYLRQQIRLRCRSSVCLHVVQKQLQNCE